jgi:hypothetical protein
MESEQISSLYSDHSANWKKYLSEVNSGALEKCLHALNHFLNYSPSDSKYIYENLADIVAGLIEKCLGHVNEQIRTQSMQNFLLIFEVTSEFL